MRLPRDVSGTDLAKVLQAYGYRVTRQTGSHMRLTTGLAVGVACAASTFRTPEPDSVFMVTAYELMGKPLTAYRRRRRKKEKR